MRKAIPDAFQSMLPVRGATYALKPLHLMATISIHAPRAGSDFFAIMSGYLESHFNPCSPCGERPMISGTCTRGFYFNPCSPCGERLQGIFQAASHQRFQSMLPVRGATSNGIVVERSGKFQSMLPVRGATSAPCNRPNRRSISIHAPRAGSDGKIRQNTGCILAK